ncbi:MAG: DUF362 domain-containing protein [Phycisphaerae bacterium]
MSRIQTRRRFMLDSAALGVAALAAPRFAPAGPTDVPVDMSIARWKPPAPSAALPDAMAARLAEAAIVQLGGMSRFVRRGDVVWIKPNIGWNRKPEHAANTHPHVVAQLVRMCQEAGAKTVKVGDNPCNDPKQCYENSGIAPAARALGAEIVFLDRDRFRNMAIGGKRLKQHPVYPELVECDLVINVPVCKHHGETEVSLCMKNYMGVVEDRGEFHQDLPATITDLTRFMKPRLCVLDATRMLVANGPTGGRLDDVRPMFTVAAGTDIVALDAFGCELLGHKPESISTVAAGRDAGLGRTDYRALSLKETELS